MPSAKYRFQSLTDQQFTDKLAEVSSFIASTGRRPLVRSGGEEARVAGVLQRFRRAAFNGELPPERYRQVMEVSSAAFSLPGAAPLRSADGTTAGARRVVRFYAENGRMPHHLKDPSAYVALRNLRNRLSAGTIRVQDLKLLSGIPGALTRVRLDPLVRLEELRLWCLRNGRMPRHTIRRETLTPDEEIEQSLGQWMYRHVVRRHKDARETEETMHVRSTILELKTTYGRRRPQAGGAPAAGLAA